MFSSGTRCRLFATFLSSAELDFLTLDSVRFLFCCLVGFCFQTFLCAVHSVCEKIQFKKLLLVRPAHSDQGFRRNYISIIALGRKEPMNFTQFYVACLFDLNFASLFHSNFASLLKQISLLRCSTLVHFKMQRVITTTGKGTFSTFMVKTTIRT